MKIGIGVTAYKRPDVLELCLNEISNNTSDYQLYVYNDTETKLGVAHAKNKCLEELKDCDHIFLFDDDCFPIQKGWDKWVIETCEKNNIKHCLYLKETGSIRLTGQSGDKLYFNNCGGSFMYIHKDCFNEVGYFNSEYIRYGYEHAGYSIRCSKAGMCEHPYISLKGIGEYIYSLDYDFWKKYDIKIESSVIDEIDMVEGWLAHNYNVFLKDTQTIKQ